MKVHSEQKSVGRSANKLKEHFTSLVESRWEELLLKASEIPADFDFTVPGIMPSGGGLHPITQMCYDLNDTFRSMGFEIFQESDITSELYAFDNLNFPPDHPARESMDTYWLAGHDTGHGGRDFAFGRTLQVQVFVIFKPTNHHIGSYIPAEYIGTNQPMRGTRERFSNTRHL